ncbi:MAG: 30S ribosomal protein S20 [Muribaculaceae bacterium]|nr:30S ribosomal protein S20 [Muribaculaceae bacterium]
MANHKSSIKRIRQTAARRLRNRYYEKTCRNAVRRVRKMTNKAEAEAAFSKLTAMLDKLAAKRTISKNKAANLKSKIARYINTLAA